MKAGGAGCSRFLAPAAPTLPVPGGCARDPAVGPARARPGTPPEGVPDKPMVRARAHKAPDMSRQAIRSSTTGDAEYAVPGAPMSYEPSTAWRA
ncbi:hypothetical protein GCM10010251_16050 [Streptomyces aurantiogriseus]|uniref:Uncharacterized protein n=1 Tax=Streptomyces aurantiogriseus TaxID=66870 RepID=A0A918C0G7_9ACTN|nr:hypothetical protein GCM10010251_16050 [Streptomyces aurantiogriseus]